MRVLSLLCFAVLAIAPAFSQAKPNDNPPQGPNSANAAAETIANSVPESRPAAGAPAGLFAMGLTLFDNGSLVNSPGTGPGGADESLLQDTSLGMGSFGFSHSPAGSFRVADDFTVPVGGGWDISSFTFFAYQTGSTTTSTITTLNLQIWDGPPGEMGSSVVWGDLATNRLASTTWSGIYRGIESAPGATNRPIMANTVNVNAHFDAGTYWLDWRTGGSLGSGPWAPPVTIDGMSATGNARQFDGVSWASLTDVGPQGLPFIVEGTRSVPTLGEYGLMAFIALLLVAGLVQLRKTRIAV